MAELLFGALGGAKPKRPGMARDAYKAARSATWRARHDRNISATAAGGAAAALVAAVDAAAPRIIVGLVDRSVRTKSGGRTRPKLGRKLRRLQVGEVSEAEKNDRTDG